MRYPWPPPHLRCVAEVCPAAELHRQLLIGFCPRVLQQLLHTAAHRYNPYGVRVNLSKDSPQPGDLLGSSQGDFLGVDGEGLQRGDGRDSEEGLERERGRGTWLPAKELWWIKDAKKLGSRGGAGTGQLEHARVQWIS